VDARAAAVRNGAARNSAAAAAATDAATAAAAAAATYSATAALLDAAPNYPIWRFPMRCLYGTGRHHPNNSCNSRPVLSTTRHDTHTHTDTHKQNT